MRADTKSLERGTEQLQSFAMFGVSNWDRISMMKVGRKSCGVLGSIDAGRENSAVLVGDSMNNMLPRCISGCRYKASKDGSFLLVLCDREGASSPAWWIQDEASAEFVGGNVSSGDKADLTQLRALTPQSPKCHPIDQGRKMQQHSMRCISTFRHCPALVLVNADMLAA